KTAPGLKKNLNPEQQQVVASQAEYIIVKAGPGTGKTHTLVRRVIRMVTEEKTFCTVITFTNKAADELQQRLDQELGPAAPVFVATFHGYCLHWLRRDNPGLRVAGPEMRRWLLRSLYPDDTAGEFKKREQDIAALLEKTPAQLSSCPAGLQPYFAALEAANLVDIDAVIPLAASLLRQRDQAAATMRRAAGALFIDEFQDLNGNQYDLVLLLAATSPVFAIGDPNQAIYGFRGSDPAWFYRFIEALHPEQHSLVRNYRSGPVLVKAAGQLIGADPGPDSLAGPMAGGEGQGDIFIHRSSSAVAEAVFIAGQVERLLGGTSHREIDKLADRSDDAGLALGDIAVLYRTGRQAEVLAGVFAERGLPVQVVDIVPFYLSDPALVLYLWVLIAAERGDSANLLALLGREKGIGRRSLGGLEPLLPVGCRDPLAALSGVKEKLPARLGAAVADFQALRTRLRKTAAETGIEPALRSIVLPRYQLDPAEGEVVRFLRLAVTFGSSLTSLADHLQHYKDSVVYDKRAEAVALMTLHASKGLEFPVVFLAGLEEGLLPFAPRQPLTAAEEQRHLEEERRLFYVGLTRAERMVFLSHAAGRRINGKTCSRQPSRFLREIPAALLRRAETGQANRRHARNKIQQLSLF
ncbi:MAG TPA: ATP-dependent helicase, partial [Desulfobacteraceae bacterium]|nr:ATP-dependent helicase [Desulfobacteraceae bacterium]